MFSPFLQQFLWLFFTGDVSVLNLFSAMSSADLVFTIPVIKALPIDPCAATS